MSVVLYDGVVRTPRNVDGRRSVPGDSPCAVFLRSAVPKRRADLGTSLAADFPVLTGLRGCIVGLMASGKRLWRQPNNPLAPRKFPGCRKFTGRSGHTAFLFRAEPGSMRSGGTGVLGPIARRVSTTSSSKAASVRLAGPKQNTARLKPQHFLEPSVLT
jgi:hypothetical protein